MKTLVAILFTILLFTPSHGQSLPSPVGFVNDYTGALSNQTLIQLESTLVEYEKTTGREIAVAIIKNLEGTTVEDYAVRLFEQWEIGKKGQDNGILFLVALDDRQMRIEVGYGLEGVLTDTQSKVILDDIVRPSFKLGDYDKGVKDGVEAVIKVLNSEPIPENITTTVRRTIWDTDLAGILIWLGFFASSYFFSVAARSKSFWAGGIWGSAVGTIVGILAASILIWLAAAFILGASGLVFDYIVSTAFRKAKLNHKPPPWWAGGRSAFWSGFDSRSGFGGFGGGGSGGGGASGGW